MRFFVDGSITTPITEYLTNPKYQQVEYLEGTGTQYIDTGVNASGNISFVLESTAEGFNYEAATTRFGAKESEGVAQLAILTTGANSFRFDYGTGVSSQTQWVMSAKNVKEFKLNASSHTLTVTYTDGDIQSHTWNPTITTFTSQSPILIFAYGLASSTTYYASSMKVTCCKLWDGNTLVRNFIPAIRKEDGKPGMYDKVSGQFFTNAGTGEFLYGKSVYNGVPKGYKECEYLESTGPQWIDTGFKPNPATTKIDCAFCALAGGSTQMFGVRTIASSADANNTNICFGVTNGKVYIRGDWIRNHANLVSDIEPEEYIHLIAHNQTMYINDVEYTYDSAKNNTYLDYNFCLFACNTAGSISFYNRIRQYYFKIYDNGILVRDYVPVLREANNAPGMYDRVSNTFFANKGTGTFTYKLKERQTEKVTRIAYSGSKMRLVRNTTA